MAKPKWQNFAEISPKRTGKKIYFAKILQKQLAEMKTKTT
jgi:hypothetical protein